MADASFVKMLDCENDLFHYLRTCHLIKPLPFLLLHVLEQIVSFAQLLYEVKVHIVHIDLLKLDDVRVVNVHQYVKLLLNHFDV